MKSSPKKSSSDLEDVLVATPVVVADRAIPDDLELKLPENSKLDREHWNRLIYIPWNDKYLERVPEDFRDFFKFVLPHLGARTTDVHTAISLGFLDQLLGEFAVGQSFSDQSSSSEVNQQTINRQVINRRVVAIALILHDAGWSRLSDQEIADSLGVKGLKLNETAMGSKEKHAVESEKIAREVLGDVEVLGEEVDESKGSLSFNFYPPLSLEEKQLICKAIRYHDKPEEVVGQQTMPIEVQLLVDLDHTWSFTHENFWQDTIRKGVVPEKYLENLENDLDSYFVTEPGKNLAKKLLEDRKAEVG